MLALLLLLLQEPWLDAGPLVGHVGPDHALVWAKASGKARLSVEFAAREDLEGARSTAPVDVDPLGVVRLDGLAPSTRIWYRVLLDGKPAMSRPWPSFLTAPPPGAKERLRVAFGSCTGRDGSWAAGAWGDMAVRPFEVLLMLGDNHYADTTDPAKLSAAYLNHRRPHGFAAVARRAAVYAIWDDHDYGPNNSDGTTKGKEDSLRVFREWWANPAYGEPENPGVYFRFSRGDVDVFMLDSRYHRTPNKAPDDGAKTMLGARQLAWLKEGLETSRATFKLVACGSEFQSFTQPDGWASFRRERDALLDWISEKKISGLILLSGDRHFTAAYQIRGRFLEVTSGPLGSRNAVVKPSPEAFLQYTSGKLYTILDLDPAAPSAALEIYRAGDGLLERRAFSMDEIDGVNTIAPLQPK